MRFIEGRNGKVPGKVKAFGVRPRSGQRVITKRDDAAGMNGECMGNPRTQALKNSAIVT
jgi:hypothetical protein